MMMRLNAKLILFFIFFALLSCAEYGPEEIHYGQDQCDYCKMNIIDNRFGSELVTNKGKVYKFDSIECLAAFTQTSEDEKVLDASLWINDFGAPGTFVRIDSASVVFNEDQNSPMGVGLFGFSSESQASAFVTENGGDILSWTRICELVIQKWNL